MDSINTSSYMAASSLAGKSFRNTHFTAIFLPVARCVPRQTVANDPDLSYIGHRYKCDICISSSVE